MELLIALEKRHDRKNDAIPNESCNEIMIPLIVDLLKGRPELLPIDTTSLLRHLHSQIPTLICAKIKILCHWEKLKTVTFVTGINEIKKEAIDEKQIVQICKFTTRARCRQLMKKDCSFVHFVPVITRKTKLTLGDCKYLDKCHRQETCKYIHYQPEIQAISAQPAVSDGVGISCDVTTFDFKSLGKFDIIVMDPPWDIQMKLDYPTMSDESISALPIQDIQDNGWLFLWVATGKIVAGRRMLKKWGYSVVEDIVWVLYIDQN
ncbi:mRNA (2'-O-methyladenosine-N6-)-methyltransferase [Thraustotheca clavata]|uniref:mRNA m(6)A methyltransferase n=1 Tax=Thraustotheca clavata TaxID=74557 RepID=A0A1V9ZCA7_9STRA|nr:mRNA (2'-O-methyladenosine-N6-)-methyltransferase [Thraustotheca clavata]